MDSNLVEAYLRNIYSAFASRDTMFPASLLQIEHIPVHEIHPAIFTNLKRCQLRNFPQATVRRYT